jgi:hypothetical protein
VLSNHVGTKATPLARYLRARSSSLGEVTGFGLAYLREAEQIRAVAGHRISEWLAGGKYLEIEDLVSKISDRSKGYGGALFDWLISLAAQHGCQEVRLVSNVRRADAHRFYLRKGMTKEAYYFSIDVNQAMHRTAPLEPVKYWEIIADRSHAEGWSYGIAEHLTKQGLLFCVDARRDGKTIHR